MQILLRIYMSKYSRKTKRQFGHIMGSFPGFYLNLSVWCALVVMRDYLSSPIALFSTKTRPQCIPFVAGHLQSNPARKTTLLLTFHFCRLPRTLLLVACIIMTDLLSIFFLQKSPVSPFFSPVLLLALFPKPKNVHAYYHFQK